MCRKSRTAACAWLWVASLAVAPPDAMTQDRPPRSPQVRQFRSSPRLFAGLFAPDPRRRLQTPDRPPRTVLRERPANRFCEGCESRPGDTHLIIDSPMLSDAWLARHTYQANGGSYGDNAVVSDFWYDAVHRRIFTRSAAFRDVDDPADVRIGRAPGTYPNVLDFTGTLDDGTTVGQVGFETWTHNGFGAYFAAVQGAVRDEATGYLDLATTTGENGRTRTGSSYESGDLLRHVRLHPSGQLEVGYETNPDRRPDPLLRVRGNQVVEGGLTIEGGRGNVPHACVLQHASVIRGKVVAARCEDGGMAIGGGGTCGAGDLIGSRPLQRGATVDAWEIACDGTGAHTAYVICCAR